MSLLNIPRDIKVNIWNENPHLIYLPPFSQLYNRDKSKDKSLSSKEVWCIIWLVHPDEEENKYYRIPYDERITICQDYCPEFDPDDQTIRDCLDKYPELCLDSIQQSYKISKDQLNKISKFLNQYELDLENLGDIVKHMAALPKIYKEFAATEKDFQKNKTEQRVHGGRSKTIREKGYLTPEE